MKSLSAVPRNHSLSDIDSWISFWATSEASAMYKGLLCWFAYQLYSRGPIQWIRRVTAPHGCQSAPAWAEGQTDARKGGQTAGRTCRGADEQTDAGMDGRNQAIAITHGAFLFYFCKKVCNRMQDFQTIVGKQFSLKLLSKHVISPQTSFKKRRKQKQYARVQHAERNTRSATRKRNCQFVQLAFQKWGLPGCWPRHAPEMGFWTLLVTYLPHMPKQGYVSLNKLPQSRLWPHCVGDRPVALLFRDAIFLSIEHLLLMYGKIFDLAPTEFNFMNWGLSEPLHLCAQNHDETLQVGLTLTRIQKYRTDGKLVCFGLLWFPKQSLR